MSVLRIVTPGADHFVAGGVAETACSSVSNRRKPNPLPSTGSTQWPEMNPVAAFTLGRVSLLKASAAFGARLDLWSDALAQHAWSSSTLRSSPGVVQGPGELTSTECYLFLFVGFFVGRLRIGFFFPPLELPLEEGFTVLISFVPMGEPRPVQASHPGPAVKPTGEPE
jgi:hypothetical protein